VIPPNTKQINGLRLVASSPEKAGVGGSIPSLATTFSTTYRLPTPRVCSKLFQKPDEHSSFLEGRLRLPAPHPEQMLLSSGQSAPGIIRLRWLLFAGRVFDHQHHGDPQIGSHVTRLLGPRLPSHRFLPDIHLTARPGIQCPEDLRFKMRFLIPWSCSYSEAISETDRTTPAQFPVLSR